jgi:UDP-N-acetylglucosamine 2-epimerase (hydrolysing)
MAGALAAYYRRIDVGHIEAGLRTGDPFAPFPEETNRRVIGQVARWHFAPTATAAAALAADQLPPPGFAAARVVVTGNTVIDALFDARDRVRANPPADEALAQIDAWRAAGPGRRVVLVTGHRRENFGEPFEQFCLGLRDIAAAHPAALLLYPVHLNPNVQRPVRAILSGCPNIRLADPMGYPAFVRAMDAADLVITDSGGVQEEAPALGVPVLVTREKTERPEAVAAGGVLLVGPSRERLFAEADRLLASGDPRAGVPKGACPYGDGRAAGRILDVLLGRDVVPFA